MSEELLRRKAAQIPNKGTLSSNRMSRTNSTRWLFPELQLSCPSGLITGVTIGIEIRGFEQSYPSLELWKQEESNPALYTRVILGYPVQLTSRDFTNDAVFQVTFPIPIVISNSVYALGLFQPRDTDSTVRFYYDDNTTQVAHQLVDINAQEININDNQSTLILPKVKLLIHAWTGM